MFDVYYRVYVGFKLEEIIMQKSATKIKENKQKDLSK